MTFSYKIATLVWLAVIMVLSITPGNYLPPLHVELIAPDTIAHIGFYMILQVLACRWLTETKSKTHISDVWMIALSGVLYGYLIEILQGNFISGRYFDYADVLANAIGTSAGIIICLFLPVQKSA